MNKIRRYQVDNSLLELFDEDEMWEFGGCARNRDRDKDRDRDRDNSDIIGDTPSVDDDIAFDSLEEQEFLRKS